MKKDKNGFINLDEVAFSSQMGVDRPKRKKYRRLTFTAKLKQWNRSHLNNYFHNKILFLDVRIGPLLFRDHCWVTENKYLSNLEIGDCIEFRAIITDYKSVKGIDQFSLRSIRAIKVHKKITLDEVNQSDLRHFKLIKGKNNDRK